MLYIMYYNIHYIEAFSFLKLLKEPFMTRKLCEAYLSLKSL